MSYCKYCGNELLDNTTVCPYCNKSITVNSNYILVAIVKILMILTLIGFFIIGTTFLVLLNLIPPGGLEAASLFIIFGCLTISCILPLFWLIPMCIYYFIATKKKKKVSMSFKICSLIFGFFLPAIFMICADI